MNEEKIIENLKNAVVLNNYGIFWHLFQQRANFHFFKHLVQDPERTHIEFSKGKVDWSDRYTVEPFLNEDGFKFFDVIIGVTINASLEEHDRRGMFSGSKPYSVSLYLRASVQEEGWASEKNMSLLNQEQKILLDYQQNYAREQLQIGVKTIAETNYHGKEAFDFFTAIWKNVDPMEEVIVRDTSLHYFHELTESHRNVYYSACSANIWGRYITHYSDNWYNFQGRKLYPHQPSYIDGKFFFYLEVCIEELYTFYERLAYLAYIFLAPKNLKPFALSYNRLFDKQVINGLIKQYPELSDNPHLQYFRNRLKNQHQQLSDYRHPLVHYKSSGTEIRGSYNVFKSTKWLDNVEDEEALQKLHYQIDKILEFTNTEMSACHKSFEQLVLLCESLPYKGRLYKEPD
ncbi:conserved hypothetical protein [Sphingobacterium sp. PM2-P1-29]|nr:conserved hypothetical protein [Sphingobacterium sp. PM2-P1-29]